MTDAVAEELRPVVLLGVPVALYRRAQQRHEELMREFALIALSTSDQLPRRLLDMVAELRQSYGRFTQAQQGRLDQAVARGDQTIDLHFTVPVSAAPAAEEFAALMDEADAFCRSGDLLALAATGPLLRLRRWYFSQFITQLAGQPPVPWRDEDDDA